MYLPAFLKHWPAVLDEIDVMVQNINTTTIYDKDANGGLRRRRPELRRFEGLVLLSVF